MSSLAHGLRFLVGNIGLSSGYQSTAYGNAYALAQLVRGGNGDYIIRIGNNAQGNLTNTQTDMDNNIAPGHTVILEITRDSSDNIVFYIEDSQASSNTFTVTKPYSDVFPTSKTWSDIDHLTLERWDNVHLTSTMYPLIKITQI